MTGDEFRALALSFAGTTAAPHFDRTAFKLHRTFATLAADGASANVLLTPDEQEHHAGLQPGVFRRVPNKWGDQGWTTVSLADVDAARLRSVLESAWRAAHRPQRSRGRSKR
ncbi:MULTISPECIES: MmcQ/YjbR family DNA-binding protein [unclassified Bradyrhizobium]|uniref:MmcQ/YjbR family DNA-binding protein n=1 Tax=Bradyrhizobium TaxID=374 RepID=UPI0028EB61E2|nr:MULTISPECIES: MmcQ/YjbR family DNA-binding protein [unclassified Bradyrhizobium]